MEQRKFPCSSEGYSIEMADESRCSDIVEMLMDNFLLDETLLKSLRRNANLDKEQEKILRADERVLMKTVLDIGINLVAIHKETKRIAGVLVILTYERGNETRHEVLFEGRIRSQVIKDFFTYEGRIEDNVDLFEMYPDCQAYVEFELVGVNKLDRRRGIGLDLCEAALKIAEENPKVSLVYGVYTSAYSTRIAEKIGKKTIFEVDVKEFRDNKGAPVFQDTEPHNVISLMTMEI